LAVDKDGQGLVADLTTEIRGGSGLVLVNINNLIADGNTQYSARVAANVASNYTHVDMSNLDVIFNIKTDASVIGGQSAGSTMTVSVIAGLLNQSLNEGVMMTGSILEDGRVGEAASISAKALAAKGQNASLFLVPKGLEDYEVGYKKGRECGEYGDYEYCRVYYLEDKIYLSDRIGLEIVGVEEIGDVVRYFLE
jgi:uncharacterized protein